MFHLICGRQAAVTEDGWAANRRDFASHFNKAVVASRRPLEQGELFEVRLVKKQTTWSGSIKIGITPTPPEKLDFPNSIVGLRDGSIVLSGHNVTVNGETRCEQYSNNSLDSLSEGGSVGVVISNRSAYFHVNGQNLGPAIADLPSVPYWVLIDLYGQCVEVKIAPREMERASNADTTPLTFHSRCGRFVHLSDDKRSASRNKAIDEFNNGVVLSNRPLNDYELFEVVIVKKVSKWSGSLELGVTAHKSETLEIPSSLSEAKEGMWVLSGDGMIRDGDGVTSDVYTANSIDGLPESSRVGVVKKGNGNLHFYINGIDQGVAITQVPSNVYAIVDIYGQTAEVALSGSTGTMVGLPASAAVNTMSYESSVDPLQFHKKCGKFARVAEDGRSAHRIKPSEDFNYGIVMSDRPLNDNELFEVEIKQLVDRWSGSLEIGVSTQNPEGYDFPSSSMNMRSGTWIMSGNAVQCDGHILCCSYDANLDYLKMGDRVGVLRKTNGDLHFYINGRDLGRAVRELPVKVFGVVDVYGICSQVALTSEYDSSGSIGNSTRSPRRHGNAVETLSSLLGRLHHRGSRRRRHSFVGSDNSSSSSDSDNSDSGSSNTMDVIATGNELIVSNEDGPLCFHRTCGVNGIIHPRGRVANRRNPESEFNGAVCLTSRPLHNGELFEIEVNQVISRWSGSLEMGVTLIDPDELEFPDTMTDVTYDTWILSGSTVMKGGNSTLRDYGIDLDSIQPGHRIGVMRRQNGDLHFYLDGKDAGVAVKDVPPGVYGVVDLYGQCAQVTITSRTSQSDNRTANAESLLSPPGGWEGLHRFHHCCGRSVSMRVNNRAARRTASFNNGVVLSSEPLKNGELFEVRIGHMARRWAGSVEIGVTTLSPDELHQTGFPDTCTSFSRGTWVVSGSTVLMNGSTHKESYCQSLDSLKEGDRVGVVRESDGTMHVHINDQDQGIAATGIPPVIYAVVDLYGQTEEVVITSKKQESPEYDFRAPASKTDKSRKEEAVIPVKPTWFEFWKNCGKHIELSNGNRTATRTSSYNCGLVCSHVPLQENQPFQVRLLRVNQTWSGSLMIGVVGEEPDAVVSKQTATGLKKEAIIVNSSAVTVDSLKVKDRYCKNLESLIVGDEIGVVHKRGGGLHILINGEDQGEASPNVPPNCYAVVDVYGMAEKVRIVGPGVEKEKEDDSDDGEPVVDKEEKRVHSEVKEETVSDNNETLISKPVPLPVPDRRCPYQELCYRFITSLAIPEGFMNREFDRCFCLKCHRNRGDADYYTRGEPPATYALPIGWARRSLKVPPRAVILEANEKWHVAYHGTQAKNVRPILDGGDLLFPGDVALGGMMINEGEGHFKDDWKPKGFDTKQIFLSPSMKYAGLQVYAKKQQFIDPLTKKQHEARVAFQVRIRPKSYTKGKLTIKFSGQIDDKFLNNEIEWATKERGAVILYGLLTKIENP